MKILISKQFLLTTQLLFTLSFAFGQQTPIDNTVYASEILTIKPVYKGGDTAMYKMLASNLRFPPILRQRFGTIGTAFISFIIDEQGKLDTPSIKMVYFMTGTNEKEPKPIRIFKESKLDNIQIVCVEEAKRVILVLTTWTPAQVEGKPVKCRHSLPITFKNEGITFRR
jgi:hypothetical protein